MGPKCSGKSVKQVIYEERPVLPHLILHLDVNKTIVMADAFLKKWCERVCNEILTHKIYGTVKKDEDGKACFECKPDGFRRSRFDQSEEDDNHLNYHEFVVNFFNSPQYTSREIPKRAKLERRESKTTFTNPGHPGEKFRYLYEKMLGEMLLGDEEREKLEAAGIPVRGEREGKAYHFIVPAFFKMIIDLTKKGRKFSIVFRTYGTDLNHVQKELNLFCEGKHPCYRNVRFDGSGKSRDLRLHDENCGKIAYDMKPKPKLTWGNFRNAENWGKVALESKCEPIEGNRQVFDSIKTKAMKGLTTGISDDWRWWHVNNSCAQFGKLFLIEQEDKSCHQMFFDDNVGKGDLKIVNCRDLRTLDPVPYDDAFKVYVECADSYSIILDKMWFVKAIEAMEKKRLEC
jgi:hypothetical protein